MSGNSPPTPLQNNLMPAPVPVDSTIALDPALLRPKSSATARLNG
jgi:hypothetical protein